MKTKAVTPGGVRVNKEELLQSLEDLKAGLSRVDILDQSSCFAIQDGVCQTYNDDIAVRASVKLGKINGAVKATSLLSLLKTLPDEEVGLSQGEGELLIEGKGRKAGVRMEAEVVLPVNNVDKPGKWLPLHADFTEALAMVQACASSDLSEFATACVHLHPKRLEAATNWQMMRYRMKTGFADSSLVKKDSIKHVLTLNVTEFSETKSWVHFRNLRGLVISCRRFKEEFLDLAPHLKMEGVEMDLPKGLAKELKCAEIFSSENAETNQVMVRLLPGKLKVEGRGVTGWFIARKNIKYSGKELAFLISPKLLLEITEKHNQCLLSGTRLMVDGGPWVYAASLGKPEEAKE